MQLTAASRCSARLSGNWPIATEYLVVVFGPGRRLVIIEKASIPPGTCVKRDRAKCEETHRAASSMAKRSTFAKSFGVHIETATFGGTNAAAGGDAIRAFGISVCDTILYMEAAARMCFKNQVH